MSLQVLLISIQILVAVVGLGITWRIFKLLNHGNAWWLMSLGFFIFIFQSLLGLFAPHISGWWDFRLLYLPIIVRVLFVVSSARILFVARREHEELLKSKGETKEIFIRLRELTEKSDPTCSYWDPIKGCQNPLNQ